MSNNMKLVLALLIAVFLAQNAAAQTVNGLDVNKSSSSVHRPKVGVVLSGGGAKGFAHIRVLKAIEDAGVPIDYIAGTSMGSIIGGLYAVGYDPEMMEELTTKQDWNLIIKDKVPRKFMSLDNRLNKRNYLLKLPIKDRKVSVKNSLVDGVYVNLLLTRLTLPAYNQRDFNNLTVPFFCVATDMTTSTPVIWEGGSLSRAIRSSMSIPFLFAPVEYGDRLLCDGGLLNNFPVRLMREKGADIVIGVDLEKEYVEKEELDNSLKILERLITVVSQHESDKAREECDIIIKPDIGKANMLSFNDFGPILECGAEAGKTHEKELKALADSLQLIESFKINRPHAKPIDSIAIADVEVKGVGYNDAQIIKSSFLTQKLPRVFAIDEIEEIIIDNYSTGFYSDIWYEVKPSKNGNVLVFHCKSNDYQTLGLTAHCDNNYGVQMLVNYSQMIVSKNSKRRWLGVDVCFAEFPYFKANYITFINNNFRLGAEASSLFMKLNLHSRVNTIFGMYGFQDNKLNLYTQYVPNLNQQLSLGFVAGIATVRDKIFSIYEYDKSYSFFPYFYLRYFFNNEDDPDFVRSGWNVNFIAKCVFPSSYDYVIDDSDYKEEVSGNVILKLDVNKAFPIATKHSIRVGAVATMPLIDNSLGKYYQMYCGGQSKMQYIDNIIPIAGVPFVSLLGDNIVIGKASWHWNIYKGLYTTINCDSGFVSFMREGWFDSYCFTIGSGLTVGYKTPVGPVEFGISKNNKFEKPVFSFNLGFWF